jgi:LacI family transcriptional regulator
MTEIVKPMTKLSRVTLADVARAAGLSLGGASYALRAHPSIPAQTVERVRRLADALGYRPDLRISSLMATIRSGRPLTARETLAFVWINTPKRTEKLPLHLQHYVRVILHGARARADQRGCDLEEFWLDERNLRPLRLHQILSARGISGIVVSPAASDHAVVIDWDWRSFAAAIIGNTECTPSLHRSALYHYRSVWLTLERLRAEGFTRPAAILSRNVQDRIHSMQLAAFLTNHPVPKAAVDYVRFGLPEGFGELGPWLRRLAPDSLILGWQVDERTVGLLRSWATKARRIVTIDWHPHGVLPGIDPCNSEIAANAVDLVIAQLHRNERGIPPRPTTLLLDGMWRETWKPDGV